MTSRSVLFVWHIAFEALKQSLTLVSTSTPSSSTQLSLLREQYEKEIKDEIEAQARIDEAPEKHHQQQAEAQEASSGGGRFSMVSFRT